MVDNPLTIALPVAGRWTGGAPPVLSYLHSSPGLLLLHHLHNGEMREEGGDRLSTLV